MVFTIPPEEVHYRCLRTNAASHYDYWLFTENVQRCSCKNSPTAAGDAIEPAPGVNAREKMMRRRTNPSPARIGVMHNG